MFVFLFHNLCFTFKMFNFSMFLRNNNLKKKTNEMALWWIKSWVSLEDWDFTIFLKTGKEKCRQVLLNQSRYLYSKQTFLKKNLLRIRRKSFSSYHTDERKSRIALVLKYHLKTTFPEWFHHTLNKCHWLLHGLPAQNMPDNEKSLLSYLLMKANQELLLCWSTNWKQHFLYDFIIHSTSVYLLRIVILFSSL